ncbi:MAG: hypothetical protein J2P53_05330, partial [Bradyrhizobiaceae bacterium]|nr:hypothetical protein [Bradyrhizobiaceae bacterium]
MANPPEDRPGERPRRPAKKPVEQAAERPAKKPRKDPARPTRAKAAREDLPSIAPALADLLNPAINRGEAGVGSQTGLGAPQSRLQPPPDNSRDRRADSAAAHRARASTPELPEGPGTGHVARLPQRAPQAPAGPGEMDPDLARAFGITDDDAPSSESEAGASLDALRLPRVLPL